MKNNNHFLEYAWWFSKEENYFNALDPSNCVKGFDKSLELVKSVLIEQVLKNDINVSIFMFETQGPFDGILAFSQGAGLLHILLHLRETDPGDLYRWIDLVFISIIFYT